MKRLLVLASALLLVWGCSEGLGPQETPSGPSGNQLLASDSVGGKCVLESTDFVTMHGCPSTSATSLPMMHQCQINCHQSNPQPDPTHIVFSHPVYEVDVYSGGTYLCGPSDKGHAQYYSGGRVVETGALALTDSITECETPDRFGGLDSLAQNVAYHSTYKGHIDSIVISRPQPDSVVINWAPYNTDTTGRGEADMSANYSVFLFEHRPATATCLTGNDVLDQQVVRDLFRSLWDSSRTSLPSLQRTERGGWIYENPTSGDLVTTVTPSYTLTDGPCSSYYEPPESGGYIPIAHVHTHPFLLYEAVTCPSMNGSPGGSGWWNPLVTGAPSDSDIANIVANNVQEFILDSTEVYVVPTTVNVNNSLTVTQKKDRHQSNPSCVLF